jgi:hypothetical protein
LLNEWYMSTDRQCITRTCSHIGCLELLRSQPNEKSVTKPKFVIAVWDHVTIILTHGQVPSNCAVFHYVKIGLRDLLVVIPQ